jgi:hypothetical protein
MSIRCYSRLSQDHFTTTEMGNRKNVHSWNGKVQDLQCVHTKILPLLQFQAFNYPTERNTISISIKPLTLKRRELQKKKQSDWFLGPILQKILPLLRYQAFDFLAERETVSISTKP